MRRFILIDPSIYDWTGHCGEYASRILHTAMTQGYESVLLTSRDFDYEELPGIQVFPCYSWGTHVLPRSLQWMYQLGKMKNRIQANFSQTTKLQQETVVPRNFLQDLKQNIKSSIKLFFNQKQAARFVKETLQALHQLNVTQEDVIFIPNSLYYVLLGLMKIFENKKIALQWHVVFHYEFHELISTAREFNHNQKMALSVLNKLKKKIGKNQLFLYTDTEQLTEYYNQFGVFAFTTVPIPVDQTFFRDHQSIAENKAHPLQVNYIGAARSNKGYHLIPSLINELEDRYKKKICFSIQSNLNSIESDALALSAKNALEKLRSDFVKLINQPMTPQDYKKYVLSSDIALIPYDADEYVNRSSGIFAECMVAGIPVIVPAGSWMALQLNQVVLDYHLQLIEKYLLNYVVGKTSVFAIPSTATHVIFISKKSYKTQISFLDQNRQLLKIEKLKVRTQFDKQSSLLLSLNKQMRFINISQDEEIESYFLRMESVPVSVVGMIYQDSVELTQALQEIIEYFNHYKQSAILFAKTWSSYHNPASLMEILHVRT